MRPTYARPDRELALGHFGGRHPARACSVARVRIEQELQPRRGCVPRPSTRRRHKFVKSVRAAICENVIAILMRKPPTGASAVTGCRYGHLMNVASGFGTSTRGESKHRRLTASTHQLRCSATCPTSRTTVLVAGTFPFPTPEAGIMTVRQNQIRRSTPRQLARAKATSLPKRSNAAGTLANIGRVVRSTGLRVEDLWVTGPKARSPQPRKAGSANSRMRRDSGLDRGYYRPYTQKWDGPRVRYAREGAPPPLCIYCGGTCELSGTHTSSDN